MKFKKRQKNMDKPRPVVIDSLKYKSGNSVFPFILQALLLCVTLVGFLYCVATSVDMPINLGVISLIAVPIMVIAMLFTLNTKVYIVFISVFGIAAVSVFTIFKQLREKIIESFTFCYNLTVQIMVDQGYTNYKSAMTEDITELLDNASYMDDCFYTVIIVLAIVFSVIFSATLIKRSFVLLSALPCFLILTPSLYFGSTPSGVAFSIFISGILGCYMESIAFSLRNRKKRNDRLESGNKTEKKRKRPLLGHAYHTAANGFACMCVSLVLSLTVSLSLFSSEGMQIESIRTAIDNIANQLMNFLFYENFETAEGAIGGLMEGDTLSLKTPEFRQLPVMTVKTQTNSSIYLRGWIGKDLSDDGWKVLGEAEHAEYIRLVGNDFNENSQFYDFTRIVSPTEIESAATAEDTAKLGFTYDTVNVKAKYSKSLMIFTPVKCLDGQIMAEHSGITTTADTLTFFKENRSKNNTYSYYATLQTFADRDFYLSFDYKQSYYDIIVNTVLSKNGSYNENEQFIYNFATNEQKYSDYVKATYMSVPEGADYLHQIALYETSSYSRDIAKALAIERYFKTNYTYAQKFTTVAGTAMDKIKYMINESKTGYCTYYATAMTIMMRQLGLPARYVTGYHSMIVDDTGASSYSRDIKDENYHAWVEVYFDGIGWLSFDPTPGVSSTISVRDYDYLDDAEWEDPVVEDPSAEIPPTVAAPSVPVAPEESEITDIIGPEDEEEKKYNYDDLLPKWVTAIIIMFIVAASIFGLLLLAAFLINTRYKSYIAKLHTLPPKELICTVYPDMLRLLSSLNYRPKPGEMMADFAQRVDKAFVLPITFKSILKTLEMSQFSENDIDFKSASRVYEYYSNLSDTIFFSLNKFKKYYYMLTLKMKKY